MNASSLPNNEVIEYSALSIADDIIARMQRFIVKTEAEVALHEPCFRANEWSYVKQCLDSGWVSSAGSFVDSFEKQLANFTQVNHAIAVVNGTSALHTCLLSIGIDYHCEVLLPALSFVATANAISYTGATPHFVDVSLKSLCVDPDKLDKYLKDIGEIRNKVLYNKHSGKPIKALVAVNTFGHPIEVDPLLDVCQRYHIQLVEDAAESLGSYYGNQHSGSKALISALSFNGNKIITTGGGGAIITNNKSLADYCRHISSTARTPGWRFDHDKVAYNYRLPNINAALGLAQLENIQWHLSKKRQLANLYHHAFADCGYASIYREADFATSNYWLNVLILDQSHSALLQDLIKALNSKGYMVRPCWRLLNELPMYRQLPSMDLSNAKILADTIVCLPSSAQLTGPGHV